jgi:hypothetical protein
MIDAANFDDPTATIPGLKTIWCHEHQSALESKTAWKKGRRLSPHEFADEADWIV